MDGAKLKDLIERKNDRLERDALDEAASIIDQIGNKQALIARTNGEIKELRERLTALEVQQLDPAAILGGEKES